MGIEFELKYRATPQALKELDQVVDGPRTVYEMATTYFDTPDGKLSARHYTLRCRMENDRAVCTLKTPAQGKGRREWELDCDNIQTAIEELCKLDTPEDLCLLTAEGVIPICGARFTRIAKLVQLPGCVVELALDQGVLMGGGREIPLCEMEVELKEGAPAQCEQYARSLAQLFSLEPENKSKFRRAQLLYKGE